MYVTLHGTQPWQGASTHVREIVSGLRRRGWDVELVDVPTTGPRMLRPLRQVTRQVVALLFQQAPDVVYVRSHPLAIVTAVLCRLRRIPRVEEVNGTPEDTFQAHPGTRRLAALVRASTRWSLRLAEVAIAVNDGLADWVAAQAPRTRVTVVPNGVDPAAFHPDVVGPRPVEGPYAAYVGALVPWEGIDTLLAAAASPRWPAGVTLLVAGDGPLRPAVEAAGTPVVSLGPVPHADVPSILAQASVGISPYTKARWGASPIKLYEMMAVGLPVVATDVPGQGEVVRETGCGRLVPPGDSAALAAAVADSLADRDWRTSAAVAGRAAATRSHSWDARAAATDAVLTRVLAGPAGTGARQAS